MRCLTSVLAITCLLLTSACFAPSREDNRDALADAFCTLQDSESCKNIGPGKDYNTFDDCIVDRKGSYNDLWPSDKCTDDNMNQDKVDDCVTRIEIANNCGKGISEGLSFLSACNSDKVCSE